MAQNQSRSGPHEPASRRQRWIAWRNRVLANPRFQHWTSRLPLLNRIARRRAGALFDLVVGFTYSQVLLGVVESGLLPCLDRGPSDLGDIARATGLGEVAALRLVRAAAALDLAEELTPGRWMLGQHGAVLHANPGIQAMIRHHRLLYADLADPVALLCGDRAAPTQLSKFWHYHAESGGESAAYSELMGSSQAMVAQQVLGAYDFSRHRAVLDLGGGHGVFAASLAQACPLVRIGVFDLPPVLERTAARLDPARFTLHPGDFFGSGLPTGYDCITLVRILHDHDDAPALALLKAARRALAACGRLVIAEPMAATSGARAMGDAYFGLYLWAMNSGRPRTVAEIGAMLEAAGFATSRTVQTGQPVVTSVIVATV